MAGVMTTKSDYGTPEVVETSKEELLQVYMSGEVLYICKAALGSALGASVWQVQRIITADPLNIRYANGSSGYTVAATDLATVAGYSYS
jgi:hypothetical protein